MNKNEVIKILKDTLTLIKSEALVHGKNKLDDIIKRYELTIKKIEADILDHNDIHNSVKAYLEIYNDYDNHLLFKMSDAEKAVSTYLKF
ncbi:hypothetical protein [Pantoea sp. OXWO6B1]|uniref:hypothetical protein n=1 Tax=Pantoea TaxID=53335 RepID=UPI0007C6E32D|nr:hypothetical protein [Pantoea sp. OXWO6B1]OAE09013.1 hypothetical protein A6A26_15955 [Pantoea sp. OXWO6B1]